MGGNFLREILGLEFFPFVFSGDDGVCAAVAAENVQNVHDEEADVGVARGLFEHVHQHRHQAAVVQLLERERDQYIKINDNDMEASSQA